LQPKGGRSLLCMTAWPNSSLTWPAKFVAYPSGGLAKLVAFVLPHLNQQILIYSRPLSRRASAERRNVERMRKLVAAGIEATSFICVRPEARRNEPRRNRSLIRVHSLRRESCFRRALTGCQRRSIPSSYIEVPLSWQFAIRRLTLCFTMPACHPCRRIQSLVKDRQSWGCLVPTSAHALPAYVIYAHDNMAEACGSRIQTSNF